MKGQEISARVINMSTLKPLDEKLVLKVSKECGKIITCEERSMIGGLGEAVCSLLSEKPPAPVQRIGINNVFRHSDPADDLFRQFDLFAEYIQRSQKIFVGNAGNKDKI